MLSKAEEHELSGYSAVRSIQNNNIILDAETELQVIRFLGLLELHESKRTL